MTPGTLVFIICVAFFLNLLVAVGIHTIRKTNDKNLCFTSILLLLCSPYIIYLVVTKQGTVIDAIAAKKEDNAIKKYFKAYKDE